MSMSSSSQEEMKRLLQLMESVTEASLDEADYELNDDELSDLEHESDKKETLMNELDNIADQIRFIASNAQPELHVEPDVEQAYKYFLLGDYDEAANALLDELSDLRTSDPAPDPGYYGDMVYDMLMDLVPQHGHIDENDSDDVDYLDDEEESEEFESGDLVRFTDDYAEPDFPDEVYTLKDWDPEKGRGWAVDADGQGWSVQSFQIQHAYVDEAAPLAAFTGGVVARMAAKKGAGKMVSKAAGGATTRAADSGIKKASQWAKNKLNQMAADADDIDESLAEGGCGCDAPEVPTQTDTSINYSKTHTQDDASVTVSANARDLQQLQDMLRLAGVDADLSQAQVVEPEVVAEPEPAVTFGTRGDYSYSTDADFIRDQLMQRMKGFM